MSDSIPNWRTLLWRGCRKKCPQCGQGALFRRWITLHDYCSICGLKYLENQGDLWGYLLLIDRGLFILPLIVMIYFRLYNPYSVWFYLFAGALIFALIFTLPHRNGVCVAVDYLIRRKSGDLSDRKPS